ncbi:MAG: hypothetical protein M3O82_01855, partial [Verrucomicrobiota bacterium]|nr:hypothetical protein [Verrucomicrobiota bacterium]
MIQVSDEQVVDLVRTEIAARVRELDPLIREEILKSCEIVDEEQGIAMLAIKGKDPRRTFRRLMNKYRVERMQLGTLRGWKRSAVQELIDKHTVNKKKADCGLRIA